VTTEQATEERAAPRALRRVLVTGAGGFVGQWLLPALLEQGCEVVALSTEVPTGDRRYGERPRDERGHLRWMIGDLRDDQYVRGAIDASAPDAVIHLAAISHVPTAASDPALSWDINVTATARLLHHVHRARDRHGVDPVVLLVGSAEQYGSDPSHQYPLAETATQAPRTVYAATKAAQEILGLQQWRATGLQVVVARSFNHSGVGQTTRFLLPALVGRARQLADAPRGTPMPVGNRSPVRDFLHVRDVVAAYISLCLQGTPGEAYNVASGIGWSVQQLLDRVLARCGSQAVPVEDPALVRPVDVPVLIGDPRKLQHATSWRAVHSLDDIIDDLRHAATF